MSCWALVFSCWCCCWNRSLSSPSVSTFTNTSFWPVLLNSVLSIWFWIWRVLDVGIWTCPLRLWFSCEGSTVLTAICRPWEDGMETNPWSWACWNFPTAKCGIVASVVGKPPNGVKLIVKQWACYLLLHSPNNVTHRFEMEKRQLQSIKSNSKLSSVWHTKCGNSVVRTTLIPVSSLIGCVGTRPFFQTTPSRRQTSRGGISLSLSLQQHPLTLQRAAKCFAFRRECSATTLLHYNNGVIRSTYFIMAFHFSDKSVNCCR